MRNATRAKAVAIGNVKGGTAKSTTAMHLCVALQRLGYEVGAIDLDPGQQTFFRYIENRKAFSAKQKKDVPIPHQRSVRHSDRSERASKEKEELDNFSAALEDLLPRCDVVLIDTPGSDTYLARLGHATADTLITPINDSLIDLDLLARYDATVGGHVAPSIYTKLVWETNQVREQNSDQEPIDWRVVINRYRVGQHPTSCKGGIWPVLRAMEDKLHFRTEIGVADRDIFRNLFGLGLTLYDIDVPKAGTRLREEYDNARPEMDDLLEALGVQSVKDLAA